MASTAPAHVHIEGLQTALPTRVVEPGRTRPGRGRASVVLYYRADEAPWDEAVWVKESLSEALADHPEMAGRLRRRADGSWEVKLNDTGVRLVLPTVEATVEKFVGADDKDRARRETALAPWTDVNAEGPDMCALCFLQV